jgi:hypothetical protein
MTLLGINNDGGSDSDLDGKEEYNDDAVGDGDFQDSLRKALACYDAVW